MATNKDKSLQKYLDDHIVSLCKENDEIKHKHSDESGGLTLQEPEWGNYKTALQDQNNKVITDMDGILDEIYLTRLKKIFEMRGEYSILDYLVVRNYEKDDQEGNVKVEMESVSIKDIKEAINSDVERLLWENDCIYQSFWCDNEVLDQFYKGDNYIGLNKNTTSEQGSDMLDSAGNDLYAFVPTLTEKMEELMGKDNFSYDGYSFGNDDFGLFWLIHKTVYLETMKKIGDWLKYEGLQQKITYEIKKDEF